MARLILRYPNNVIREVDFEQPRYRIGGAADNDLILEGEDVSPHQAEIVTSNGTYEITDLSEDKSTTVNGKHFEKINITYGDRIAFGNIIALFYPAQKKKLGERTKVIFYIGAGAGVILISVAIIFIMTTRQISSVVTQKLGTPVPVGEVPIRAGEPGSKEPGRGLELTEKVLPEREMIEPGGPLKPEVRLGSRGFFKRYKLALPEPALSDIQKRPAVAVPNGIGRLFFRKIPVFVELVEEKPVSTEEEAGVKGIPFTPSSGLETPLKGVESKELPPAEEVEEETLYSEKVGEEFEKGLLEKKGLVSTLLSPLRKLFGRKETVTLPPLEEEYEVPLPSPPEPAATAIAPASEGEVVPRPEVQDIQRVTDPLKIIKSLDVPSLREKSIEEKPVYTEEELRKSAEGTPFDAVTLSGIEDVNTGILWQYQGVSPESGIIVRSGTVNRVKGEKSYNFIFGTREGELVVLNGLSGDVVIKEELSKVFYEPVVADLNGDGINEIVLAYETGDIETFTPALERLWHYSGRERITAMPLIIDVNGDGAMDVVFPTFNMEIVALDGKTGFELWRFFDAESEIIFPPAGVDVNDDGVLDVVFVTVRGFLYVLDGRSGWGLWKSEIFGRPAGPSTVGDIDGDGYEELINLTMGGALSVYRKDGKFLFMSELEGNFSTSPSLGDVDGDGNNDIVILDNTGTIRVMDGITRRTKWRFESNEGFSPGRVVLIDIDSDGGMDVIALMASGALFVLQGKSGSVLAQYNVRGYALSTPLALDINGDRIDEILVTSYSGNVFALQVVDTKKSLFGFKRSLWVAAHHDTSNTGYSRWYRMWNLWR
ncbi:MAG: FG-GAP-like repeat-containing protein [Spirochaetota bacterium]